MVKIVDSYSLHRLIGKGEYGKVYYGINLETKIEVAIKVIPIHKFIQISKLTQLTKNELETLTILQNNINIIKFVEIIKTQHNVYLVYQYCEGGTLEDLISSKREEKQAKERLNHHKLHLHRSNSMGYGSKIPSGLIMGEKEALVIWKQLINAFKSLSKYNIIHRDVKPNNIFFKSGHLKLADFGFCKMLKTSDDLTQTSLGSPMYMAPQILNGDVYSTKVDIWSIGMILYELLFGVCPVSDCSIKDLLELYNGSSNISQLIPIPPNTITPTCEVMLMRMLERDQFRRISWEDIFYEYQITQNGSIIRRERDFEYDLMRLMKKNISNDQNTKGKLKYDWSRLIDLKSSIHSEQLEDSPHLNTFDVHPPKKIDLDVIYQLRKKIKQFEQQHQKMLQLSLIFQQISKATATYQYSQNVCYIIAYNIEHILNNTLSLIENYQAQNQKILQQNPNQFNTLQRIYVVFNNQKDNIINKLRQVRVLLMNSIQKSNQTPIVIRYSFKNLSLANKIAKSYLQKFKTECPEAIEFPQSCNSKNINQLNCIFLIKTLWAIISLTKPGKQLQQKIINLQKQNKPMQNYKLLNQLIVGIN